MIQSRPSTDAYRSGWERTFGTPEFVAYPSDPTVRQLPDGTWISEVGLEWERPDEQR